jgi:hypothetical protein
LGISLPALPSGEQIQNRLNSDRRLAAVLTGAFIGLTAVIFGALLAVGGPILAFGALLGIAAGVYVLTDLMTGVFLMIVVIGLLPYGTLPVKVAVTPTLLDCALGGFLLVYIFQWMTGRRTAFRIVPAAGLIIAFVLFMIFSFVAGLPHSLVTSAVLRKFTEMCLSILMAIVFVDVVRDVPTLRRIILAIVLIGAVQGVVGLVLVRVEPATAERLLNALGRFGYPQGGVVRYVNDDPTQAERAIGTWVDPNSFGFFLMLTGAIAASQMLSDRPVTGKRWIAFLLFLPILGSLYYSRSRQAQIGLVVALLVMAIARYRWLIPVLILGVGVVLILPGTSDDVQRFIDGINGQDLSTQMRLGEYKDALILINRYPLIGVGFAGTPDRDIYLGVADVYLTIAGNVGLLGLGLYFLLIAEIFRYSFSHWRVLRHSGELFGLWLGFLAAIIGALVQGLFDHFYFHIEFQAAVTIYWMFIGLALACVVIADQGAKTQREIAALKGFRHE